MVLYHTPNSMTQHLPLPLSRCELAGLQTSHSLRSRGDLSSLRKKSS